MNTQNRTNTFLAFIVSVTATFVFGTASADAVPITVLNAGFEDASGNGGNGNLTTLADWTEEDAGNVFVDNNGTTWVPEPSRTLYFNGGSAAVNQDLSYNWAEGDVFTLSMIAMNPTWATGGTREFKVQLRQADGTVLWDSGDEDVTDTVAAGPVYTGTGHIFNWTIDSSVIDANTDFSVGTPGSQLNLRIAHVSAPTYLDNVSLSVEAAVPEPSSAILAVLGLAGFVGTRGRRRNRS